MKKPPITLCYPSYVVEYAVVDDTVEYMNRRNLNVGGEWLGAVPKLAICKDIESNEFYLAHCDDDWDVLCFVESHKTIDESKDNAEKHYRGIRAKWKKTNYMEADAVAIFDEEREKMRCSFCGKSHYDDEFKTLISGEKANICNLCIEDFGKKLNDEDS